MKTLHRILPALAMVPVLGLAGCACIDALESDPYYDGTGPTITEVSPEFENGNIGGTILLSRPGWNPDGSEDDAALLAGARVTLDVEDLDADECESPTVVFGSRNAHILFVDNGRVDVLPPPGPLSGGPVDVSIACPGGVSVLEDGYDYALGEITEDGDIGRRLEPLFDDEYASFVMYYQAEPWINWPEIVGYGFFYNQPAPRASMFYGQDAPLTYGGGDPTLVRVAPPMIPELEFESPEQGDRVNGGDHLTFFRERDNNDLGASALTLAARKRPSEFGEGPAVHGSTQSGTQVVNNDAGWMVVDYTENGEAKKRYLRLGQDTGLWCSTHRDDPECEADADHINNIRVHIDATWTWFTPDTPEGAFVGQYADEVDEHVQYLEAIEGGCDPDTDEHACDPGITLPSGTYDNVLFCRSFDQFDDFPFEPDGFCIPLERVPSLQITQGAHYVDMPERVVGTWTRDSENSFYDGFDSIGDNALPRDVPVFVSYTGGFQDGEIVPGKNVDMVIPDELDDHGTEEFDEFPYFLIPNVDIGTFLGNDSDFATKWGFPADLSKDRLSSEQPEPFEDKHWRFTIPQGFDGDGFDDTFVLITLEVIDLDFTGVGNRTVWKTAMWAWADDEVITVPEAFLQTLPEIADITRPDGETQLGENLLGSVSMEIHRIIGWRIGDEFRDQQARAVFDVQTITSYYFHNQNSCEDEIDNDEDGDIDQEDSACREPDAVHESTECQDGEDNDEDDLTDADDPDCRTDADDPSSYDPHDTSEGATCGDELDNDGDGWIDAEDPGCGGETTGSSEGGFDYTVDCNNSVDDDLDGLIDGLDPGCETAADEDEGGEGDTCNDGIDNDEDGWVDGLDIACVPGAAQGAPNSPHSTRLGEVHTTSDDRHLECSDFTVGAGAVRIPKDNDDEDELANADDPECAWGGDDSESQPALECSNLLDDDGDGWIDADDPQCFLNPASETSGGTPTGNCSDGEDNDNDGWIDAQDPSCTTANDNELQRIGPLECNDNVDNDEDGDVDSADADCPTGKDAHEDR